MNMKKPAKIIFTSLVMLIITACSFSFTTSHISSLILTKEKDGTIATDRFDPHDNVYAKAILSNLSGKVTLKWRLIAEKVSGQPDNFAVADLDKTFELPSDGSSDYSLSPPDAGWPQGNYRIELHMLVESGEEKDLKTAPFTIAGG